MDLLDKDTIQAALLRSSSVILSDSGQPAIILDLASLSEMGAELLSRLADWAGMQPCPIIGVGSEAAAAAHCVDVIAETRAGAKLLAKRIASYPQASTVLVQVLRAVEHVSPAQGLIIESLAYATLQSGFEFKRWLDRQPQQSNSECNPADGPAINVIREGEQLNLQLNRPQNDNAYSVEMRDALMEVLQLVELDNTIRKVNVSAAGRCFCTGGELTEFGKVETPASAHLIRSQVSPARLLLTNADRIHFHVHKACVGSGIELPACAGRVTASAKTLFWLPELSMGLIPGAGGCVSISRRIGRRRTAYLVLSGKKIQAPQALEWGLIDAIEA